MFGWLKSRSAVEGPRFSDALTEEAGVWRVDYGDWRPLSLPGDPVIVEDMPRRQAIAVSQQFLAMAAQRAEAARALLARHAVEVASDAASWQPVDRLLGRLAEAQSGGQPGAGPQVTFRPAFWAFLHDLGFLYAQALCAACPGANLVEAGFGIAPDARFLAPYPVIARLGHDAAVEPVQMALAAGGRALTGTDSGLLANGFAMMGLQWQGLTRAEIATWHAAFRADEGREPTPDEIAGFLVDNRATEADLPPQVAALLDRC